MVRVSYSTDDLKAVLSVNKSSFELGEPILVKFKLLNKSYQSISIQLYEKAYLNFDFSIKSVMNRSIKERDYFYFQKMDKNKSHKIRKSISLQHNDLYGKSFDLSKYYELDKPGYYIVQGFFKVIVEDKLTNVKLASQIIQIEIRNSSYNEGNNVDKNSMVETISKDKIKTAYNTIEFMLKSRMAKNWKEYFTYIDLDKLMIQYPKFYKEYTNISPSERAHKEYLIEEFKDYLKDYLSEIGYLSIANFKIYKSIIENEKKKAKVFVIIKYKDNKLIFNRKYTFYLYEKNKTWYVYSWKIDNI